MRSSDQVFLSMYMAYVINENFNNKNNSFSSYKTMIL